MSDDVERERARYEALAALVDNYRRERDEARAKLRMCADSLQDLLKEYAKVYDEMERARASELALSVRYDARDNESAEAYRRGAEAMREACLEWANDPDVDRCDFAWELENMTIPEEPTNG